MSSRDKHIEEIRKMKEAYARTDSKYLRADLKKGIRRKIRELKAYDRYVANSNNKGGSL